MSSDLVEFWDAVGSDTPDRATDTPNKVTDLNTAGKEATSNAIPDEESPGKLPGMSNDEDDLISFNGEDLISFDTKKSVCTNATENEFWAKLKWVLWRFQTQV